MLPRLGAMDVHIVRDFYPAHWTRPARCPSKAQGRRCTRRGWKRANPPRFVGRYTPLEPGQIMQVGSAFYMRQTEYDALVKKLDQIGVPPRNSLFGDAFSDRGFTLSPGRL